ncbi:hypothetical protein ABK040_013864 [Willaertia magna]
MSCLDCEGGKKTSFVVLQFGTFVCEDCADAHRTYAHKGVKQIGLSVFTKEEVESLQNGGGNTKGFNTWYNGRTDIIKPNPNKCKSDKDYKQAIKDFIKKVYVDQVYRKGGSEQTSTINNSIRQQTTGNNLFDLGTPNNQVVVNPNQQHYQQVPLNYVPVNGGGIDTRTRGASLKDTPFSSLKNPNSNNIINSGNIQGVNNNYPISPRNNNNVNNQISPRGVTTNQQQQNNMPPPMNYQQPMNNYPPQQQPIMMNNNNNPYGYQQQPIMMNNYQQQPPVYNNNMMNNYPPYNNNMPPPVMNSPYGNNMPPMMNNNNPYGNNMNPYQQQQQNYGPTRTSPTTSIPTNMNYQQPPPQTMNYQQQPPMMKSPPIINNNNPYGPPPTSVNNNPPPTKVNNSPPVNNKSPTLTNTFPISPRSTTTTNSTLNISPRGTNPPPVVNNNTPAPPKTINPVVTNTTTSNIPKTTIHPVVNNTIPKTTGVVNNNVKPPISTVTTTTTTQSTNVGVNNSLGGLNKQFQNMNINNSGVNNTTSTNTKPSTSTTMKPPTATIKQQPSTTTTTGTTNNEDLLQGTTKKLSETEWEKTQEELQKQNQALNIDELRGQASKENDKFKSINPNKITPFKQTTEWQ